LTLLLVRQKVDFAIKIEKLQDRENPNILGSYLLSTLLMIRKKEKVRKN